VEALKTEDLTEVEVLQELSEADITTSKALSKLSLGERLKLRKALAGLRRDAHVVASVEGATATGHPSEQPPVNSQDLARDGKLQEQLRQFAADTDGLTELFGSVQLGETSRANTGKKLYTIPEYITSGDSWW
jgi:hypothetical protein